MFREDTIGLSGDSRRPWTFTVSLLAQCLFLCLVLLVSLLNTPLLPAGSFQAWLLEPPPPPPAPPPAPERPVVRTAPERFPAEFVQPARIPDRVAMIVEAPPSEGVEGSDVIGAVPGDGVGVVSAISGFSPPRVEPPPPPPAPVAEQAPPPSRIVVGGAVQAARILRRVEPAYPPLARQARISGVVRLRATISTEGAVEQLNVLAGHPLLVNAAVEAVKQWRYRPTLLNGRAVAVVTEIDVNFTLR